MGFFRTKDPKTGEPRLGAGVYLIICALMIGGAVLWNVRKEANVGGLDKGTTRNVGPINPSDIGGVAEAAKTHSDSTPSVEAPPVAGDTKSLRAADISQPKNDKEEQVEEADNINTIQDTLDILRTNQERAEKEKTEAVAKAKADAEAQSNAEILALKKSKPALSTSGASTNPNAPKGPRSAGFGATSSTEEGSSSNISSSLVVYDVSSDRVVQAQEKAEEAAKQTQSTSGFVSGHFLPRGHQFPVYILSTVQTTGQEDIVEMAVAENVIFQHKVQIPFGTHLLGTAAASNFEDRVMINVDTILYPDGRELPISAFLKDAYDLSSGVRGYYIPQPAKVQMTPYINEFIALWAEAAAERFQNSDSSSDSSSDDTFNSKYEAANSASDLIRKQAEKIQERLDRRYPEKVVIPIGTKAYVKLRTALDIEDAAIAGSKLNNQPILPGFENNPVRANGVIEKTANYGVTGNAALSSETTTQPTQTQSSTSAQQTITPEMQAYIESINRLDQLSKKLDKSSSSKKQTSSTNSSVDWPSGDIE